MTNTYEAKIFFRAGFNRIAVGLILTDGENYFCKINDDRMKLAEKFCSGTNAYQLFSMAVLSKASRKISIKELNMDRSRLNGILGIDCKKILIDCNEENFKLLYDKI